MNTLSQLIEESAAFDGNKTDYAVQPTELSFMNNGDMNLPTAYGNVILSPTDHAYSGVFNRLGEAVYGNPLPRRHMMGIPRELMAHDLNELMPKMGDSKRSPWFIRGYNNDARAALTTDYTAVSNTDVLKVVDDAINQKKFRCQEINHPYVTQDQVYIKITAVDVDTMDGVYGLGAMIRNDEIGKGRVGALGYIKRHKCDNSITFPAENFELSRVHRGSVRRIMSELYEALQDAFKLSQEWLEKLLKAERMQLPNFDNMLDDMAKNYGWSDNFKTNVGIGTEGRTSVAGMVHGITYAAHTVLSGEPQIEMETLAGTWLQMMLRQPQYR